MNVLIIGGTRNIGPALVRTLVDQGHSVTIFNRESPRTTCPISVQRLHGDRTNRSDLTTALGTQDFDCVVDMIVYQGVEAEAVVDLLAGRVGHYIFVSSGQVYLVREGLERPFSEDDYDGPLMPSPEPNTFGYEEWLYGMGKRGAEDVLAAAWAGQQFPYTSLRLPMVNSERDPFRRLYNYVLRIKDGGPILIPQHPQYPLRHVYVQDVVQAIQTLVNNGPASNRVYNISQEETLSLAAFIAIMADVMDQPMPELAEVERGLLEANGFLPDCSPFSDRWMSELTNARSKTELGIVYTPVRDYLGQIIQHYLETVPARPASYRRRNAERQLLA